MRSAAGGESGELGSSVQLDQLASVVEPPDGAHTHTVSFPIGQLAKPDDTAELAELGVLLS